MQITNRTHSTIATEEVDFRPVTKPPVIIDSAGSKTMKVTNVPE